MKARTKIEKQVAASNEKTSAVRRWSEYLRFYFTLEAKANRQEKAGIKYGITSSEKVIFMQSFTLFSVAFTLSTLCFQLFVHHCISTLYKR